jgi:dipeptidyl aminopeptidase/acylaminoacyl peptidase
MAFKTRFTALAGAFLVTAAAAALASAAQARPAAFTIEQVLSAPFPSSLVANRADGRVAWVSNDRGRRNVWVAEPSGRGYAARAVTHYEADDGADMGELSWDAADGLVLYSHGGSLEGGGPTNIMSLPSGPSAQQVWAASVSGGEPRLIGPGHSPAVAPGGGQVAYLLGGQVWTAPLQGEGKASQLIVDRGQTREIAWSPDGSRLAFVSTRGDHSVIGVYDFAAKAITWLQPSVDTDASPAWSPDGARLAFIRLPAGAGGFFAGDWHDAQPWSIWVADARTGRGRAVWTADVGEGSKFQEWAGGPALVWGKGDRLAFPWEKTGWLHLWSVSANGGPARDLTPGRFEISVVSPSADGARLAYSSNQDDIDHRHLWEVSLAGGAPKRLTSGDTIEDYPVIAGDGRLFALHGDARRMIEPVSLDASGRMGALAPQLVPADFPASKLVEPQQVVFTSPDGVQVHGQLFLPPEGVAAKGPAMLFFHGGPIRQMLLGWHPMDAYAFMYGMNQYLASEGYVVLSVNYRGGTGYGLDFREPKDFGWMGSSELKDIEGAVAYLRTRPDVDPARIGIWGGSYGGLMTALGLARHSDLLAAGVDYAGVHDWAKFVAQIPGVDAAVLKRAYDASAMATIDKWRSPVLVVHADDDRNVPFAQSVELVEGLRKNHVEFEQIVIPNEIHDLLRHQSWVDFFAATDDFLNRKLMNAPQHKAQ